MSLFKISLSALSSLRQKYDDEKKLVSSTMNRLRSELRTLKEDAAVFSSLRSVFASRCDEYVLQLDELQREKERLEDGSAYKEKDEKIAKLQREVC